MLNKSIIISILSLLTSFVSALNQVFIAKAFGSSDALDNYLIITSIPLFLSAAITAGFNYYLTPLLIKLRIEKNSSYNLIGISKAILYISIIIFFLGLVLNLIFYYIEPAIFDKVGILNGIFILFFAFFGINNAFLIALSNAKSIFYMPIILSMFPYLFALLFILIYAKVIGTPSISLGLAIGAGICFISLLRLNFNDIFIERETKFNGLRKVFSRKMPLVFIGMITFTCFQTIDAIITPQLGAKSMSYVSYCQRIIVSLGTIVIAGPSLLLTPYLSNSLYTQSNSEFLEIVGRTTRLVFVIAGAAAVFIALNPTMIVQLLFQRGNFTPNDTANIATLLPFYVLGILPMLGVVINFRVLMVKDQIIAAAALGGLTSILYYIFSWFFSNSFGILGVSIGYMATWIVVFGVAVIMVFKKKISTLFPVVFVFKFLFLIISLITISTFLKFLFGNVYIDSFYFVKQVILSVIYLISFFTLSGILKLEEITVLYSKFLRFK